MLFAESLETIKCLVRGRDRVGPPTRTRLRSWASDSPVDGGGLQYINGYEGGVAGFVAARGARREVRRSASIRRLAAREAKRGEIYDDEQQLGRLVVNGGACG